MSGSTREVNERQQDKECDHEGKQGFRRSYEDCRNI
jgi:hypothetical protein